MTRRIYKHNGKEVVQVAGEPPKELVSAFVHGDTLKTPLRHPKTDEMVDSMTRWNAINKEHKLECVGNDLLSKYGNDHKEKITDERFNDAYEHAYAIETDAFKRNQRINQQRQDLEKFDKAKQGRYAPGMSMRDIAQMMGLDK